VTVYKLDGSQDGDIDLNAQIFGVRVNERLLQLVLKAYAGNQRRGTHDTKERKEVRGGGRKPWRQKGTGRARAGSTRSPIWRGGGTTFGPTPRDYDTYLPQQIRRQALIHALSQKVKEKSLKVIEDIELKQPKTKELIQAVKALGLDKGRSICVVAEQKLNLKRAARNLKEIFATKRAHELNAYHVLRRKHLIIEKSALTILESRILGTDSKSKQEELVPV